MARVSDNGFWKLCGSGTGEGFTPVPNTGVYAILETWPDAETVLQRIGESAIFRRYHDRADEALTIFLRPTSSRRRWSGEVPFTPISNPQAGPIAALTRATIKPSVALKFWQHAPDISKVIGADPNVIFKIGIGEVPWMQQVTFSVWPDARGMDDFDRRDGPHARAIRAVREGQWFREEPYARFAVIGDQGTWGGRSPLQHLEVSA